MQFQTKSIPTPLEIPRRGGGGILEAKILEQAKYEAKVDFFGGGECKWGEYGYFLELHNLLHII